MIIHNNYNNTYFINSSPDMSYLPIDKGMEIVFTGRSNSGKSSVLNTISNKKKLSRISTKPGCTQFLNIFEVLEGIRLIDIPGYGYAKISKKIKRKWKNRLEEYLQTRNCIKGLVILMDIRHPLKEMDRKIIKWALEVNFFIMILLTKYDKLPKGKGKEKINIVRKSVSFYMKTIPVEIFSSRKKIGIEKLIKQLNIWFSNYYKE